MLRPRELASGLELFPVRTPTLLPATHTNSYALGGREVVLVEPSTPYEDERAAWVAWARGIESQGRTLVAILATHHHPDHVGGAEFLARELLLPVWTSEETAARVSVHVTRILKEGDEIALEGPVPQKWRVMVTPGHAPGHVCLVEDASRTAIVGDMVASVGTILIARGDGDMRVYLRELARLGELNAALALPAHGEPVDAPSALFAYYIQHRLKREKKVIAAIRWAAFSATDLVAGTGSSTRVRLGATAADILALAYDDVAPHVWPIAMLSLETHLDKLVADGVAQERDGAYSLSS